MSHWHFYNFLNSFTLKVLVWSSLYLSCLKSVGIFNLQFWKILDYYLEFWNILNNHLFKFSVLFTFRFTSGTPFACLSELFTMFYMSFSLFSIFFMFFAFFASTWMFSAHFTTSSLVIFYIGQSDGNPNYFLISVIVFFKSRISIFYKLYI